MQVGINGLFFKNKDFNLYFMYGYLTVKRPTLHFIQASHNIQVQVGKQIQPEGKKKGIKKNATYWHQIFLRRILRT